MPMMFDFTKLWSTAYLFGPAGFELVRSDKVIFYASLISIALAIVIKIFVLAKPKMSPVAVLLSRFFHLFLTMGILVLIWVGAREQAIPWISTHFMALVLFIISVVWLGYIVKYYFRKYRHEVKDWQDEQVKRKYLSRSK